MILKDIIRPDLVLLLPDMKKNDAITRLADALHENGYIKDRDKLVFSLFYREGLMSTGIGLGIGIPHVRCDEITSPVIAVGYQPEGISDYGSLDDEPVRLVLMILVGKDQHKEHVRLLSLLVSHLKSGQLLKKMIKVKTPDDLYQLLTSEK